MLGSPLVTLIVKKGYKQTAKDKRFNEEMYYFGSKHIMFVAAVRRVFTVTSQS